MLVVHPAYWRRGHGTALLDWGMQLGSLDLVKQGVIAADMGEKLYLSKGYKKLANVIATDENDPVKEVKVGILEFVPKRSTPDL
jgi:GNAT superfamily N-acetyltransferase